MIKMNFCRSIFYSLCFLSVQISNAQGKASVTASVDKNRILIGEPLQLTIEANLPPGSAFSFIHIDSISHFEMLNKPVIDTLHSDRWVSIKGIYTITSFDSGHWMIPPFVLSPFLKTDTIPMDVVFSAFDPNQDYHDIKDIIDIKPPAKKQGWWYVIGGCILLLLIVVWVINRKKRSPIPLTVAPINPYNEAMKQLEKLKKEKPEAKQYHTQLADIFRLYIFRKKGIHSLQKTTDDLVIRLQGPGPVTKEFEQLAQALRLIDFVKFAKYAPTVHDDEEVYKTIKRSIDEIEKTG